MVKRGQQMACWERWKVRRDWCVVNVGNAGKDDGTPAGHSPPHTSSNMRHTHVFEASMTRICTNMLRKATLATGAACFASSIMTNGA